MIHVLALITVALGSIMVGAAPAAAVPPTCTSYIYVWDFTLTTEIQYGATDDDNYNCENAFGDKTLAVRILQESLNKCYGPNGQFARLFSPVLSLDWQYGSKTTAAVRAVQSYIGVGVDGRAGPVTRSHMSHWDYKHEQCTVVAIPIRVWPF